MTRVGSHIEISRRGFRWLAVVTLLWLLFLLLMMGWWALVVHNQAQRIAELQVMAGMSPAEAEAEAARTQRMLLWEGGAYFLMMTALSGTLLWLYWRDRKRTDSLQAFFAGVTHELKTPLTSIRLQAEALADTSEANPLIDRLLEDTSRLEAQVEKTLELARVEGGGSLALQPLPIETWLQRFQRSAPQHAGVEIEIQPSKEPEKPLVLADPNALQIIFRNLIENTARHAKAAAARARVTLDSTPTGVCVAFRDDGQGFEGDPRKLGSLFFRGSRSQGAGVGLYLVQSLMQLMGGRAEFSTGNGAGFETRLHFRRAEDVG